MPDRLSLRELNRATLARQALLERVDWPVERMLEHLVGMQAQAPLAPYVGLWTRIRSFDTEDLARMLRDRRAVRATLMRATLHLVTAADYRRLRPVLRAVPERALWTGSQYGRHVPREIVAELLASARALLADAPLTRRELGARLAARWPDLDSEALAQAALYLLPLVQVTPRGVWGRNRTAAWSPAEDWINAPVGQDAAPDDAMVRYLAAFGPASVMDVQAWSGLTRLGEVAERLAPRLRTFHADDGRLLLDLPDAPRPPGDVPAPVRFLPEYDNLLLSHADRSRVVEGHRIIPGWATRGGTQGAVLVDGFWRGNWGIVREQPWAHLDVQAFRPLSLRHASAVRAEARRLLAFAVSELTPGDVRITVDR